MLTRKITREKERKKDDYRCTLNNQDTRRSSRQGYKLKLNNPTAARGGSTGTQENLGAVDQGTRDEKTSGQEGQT